MAWGGWHGSPEKSHGGWGGGKWPGLMEWAATVTAVSVAAVISSAVAVGALFWPVGAIVGGISAAVGGLVAAKAMIKK